MQATSSPVNSHNEWDLLEEVIVGTVANAAVPYWDKIDDAAHPKKTYAEWFDTQGRRYPPEEIEAANACSVNLVRVLEAEGVRVRRPDPIDFNRAYHTMDWSMGAGVTPSDPRDLMIVFGNEIIEAPTPRRGRVYEINAYRSLFVEYFKAGAKWTSAPRPILWDETFVPNYVEPSPDRNLLRDQDEPMRSPLLENEVLFEAADFMRCGRDIFYHRSFVTNTAGVDWLKRHLGEGYRFHEIESRCFRPMHIDTTFIPLAPGKALANPDFAPVLPPILKKWDILYAPEPIRAPATSPYQFGSRWLSLNVLSIDHERVLVERRQETLIKKLRDWGFKPIPVPYEAYYAFGGGLHCSTIDVRRKGTLESYF